MFLKKKKKILVLNHSSYLCFYSRQSSVKVKLSSGSLAEQLVVWLTSEGKASRAFFSFNSYRGRCADATSPFSAPHWFTLMQIYTFTHVQ